MNDLMTQLNVLFPSMSSPTMGLGVPVSPSSTEGSVFGNLLDIVSDMQVADAQGFEQSDFLSDRVEQLFDPELQNLGVAARQMSPLAFTNPQAVSVPSVGQRSEAPGKGVDAVEMLASPQWNVEVQELDSLSRAQGLSRLNAQTGSRVESARMWAAALATGDLKSVTLENVSEVPLQKTALQEKDLGDMGLFSGKSEAVREKAGSLDSSSWKTSSTAKVSEKILVDDRSMESAPRVEVPKTTQRNLESRSPVTVSEEILKPEEQAAPKISEAPKKESDFQPFDARKNVVEMKVEEKSVPKKTVNGSDFLLERAVVDGANIKKGEPSLVAADKLGTPTDRRISSSAVDFVAQKVDSLRQQGGGRLRVEMSPRDLGQLEIRVTMARGQMKVELLAEKPETLAAMRSSIKDLGDRLEAIAPANLQVGELSAHKGLDSVAMKTSSTVEVMNIRSALTTDTGSKAHDLAGGGDFSGRREGSMDRDSGRMSSSDWMSQREDGFRGDSRQERRQKAMNDWEEQFNKKSA